MWRRVRLIAALGAVLGIIGAGALPALAAAPGNPVLNDCEANAQLTHHYSLAQLQQALRVMPATQRQYSDCYDVIQQAIARAKGHTGGAGGGSGGSFLPTPVIVIVVLLILAGVTFGAIAVRRRRSEPLDGDGGGSSGGGGPPDADAP